MTEILAITGTILGILSLIIQFITLNKTSKFEKTKDLEESCNIFYQELSNSINIKKDEFTILQNIINFSLSFSELYNYNNKSVYLKTYALLLRKFIENYKLDENFSNLLKKNSTEKLPFVRIQELINILRQYS